MTSICLIEWMLIMCLQVCELVVVETLLAFSLALFKGHVC